MVPIEHNGRWALCENPHWVGTGGITGTRSGSGRGRKTFDRAIGEDGQVRTTGPFMTFATEEEAILYNLRLEQGGQIGVEILPNKPL